MVFSTALFMLSTSRRILHWNWSLKIIKWRTTRMLSPSGSSGSSGFSRQAGCVVPGSLQPPTYPSTVYIRERRWELSSQQEVTFYNILCWRWIKTLLAYGPIVSSLGKCNVGSWKRLGNSGKWTPTMYLVAFWNTKKAGIS